ncbi:MAG: hypothetical protein EOP06_05015 [Proteobacteria bacterium]|nr:MAG: hypothetical protein EOP06_05015 [Pseudomonadota bacterium]
MTQTIYLRFHGEYVAFEFPDPGEVVIDNVLWGKVEELLTPASWAFQCRAQTDSMDPHRFRMGETLEEEYAICVLAGYGVPAEVGMAAACHLRDAGILEKNASSS